MRFCKRIFSTALRYSLRVAHFRFPSRNFLSQVTILSSIVDMDGSLRGRYRVVLLLFFLLNFISFFLHLGCCLFLLFSIVIGIVLHFLPWDQLLQGKDRPGSSTCPPLWATFGRSLALQVIYCSLLKRGDVKRKNR